MQTQTQRQTRAAIGLLLAATALSGCAQHQPVSTSAQIQQTAQQQAAQRAAYFNSHPTSSAQTPAVNPYRGHP